MYTYVCIQVYICIHTGRYHAIERIMVNDKKVTQGKIEWNRKV